VAVIGGGAGGLTFAAGAASLGARVVLFEKNPGLLHLQNGCWHRPLHPEIFKWPDDTAYRVVSHLPLLGWSAGRAHDVADEILTKFKDVAQRLGEAKLKVRPGQTAQLRTDGTVLEKKNDIVVLAVGFGIEELPFDLPWNNYWRADPLDQPFLEDGLDRPHILVVGSGDGALIEILRSCAQSFQLGALLDRILNATLDNLDLRAEVARIEDKNEVAPEFRFEKYFELRSEAVLTILANHLRQRQVTWLMKEKPAFKHFSLPINRFIVSQLVRLSSTPGEKGNFLNGPICGAEILWVQRVTEGSKRRHFVKYRRDGSDHYLECDHAIIRYGAERETPKATDAYRLHASVASSISGPEKHEILQAIRNRNIEFIDHKAHAHCHNPQWERDDASEEKSFADHPCFKREHLEPRLHARIVRAFRPRESNGKTVYRVHIWSKGVPEYMRLIYDLHSETGRVVSRVGEGPGHEQWLNTYADYTIRARTNEGREWKLGTVVEALDREARLGTPPKPIPEESERLPGQTVTTGEFEVALRNLERAARLRP
jgi:hypothetical protein